jgi:hypothetical protein
VSIGPVELRGEPKSPIDRGLFLLLLLLLLYLFGFDPVVEREPDGDIPMLCFPLPPVLRDSEAVADGKEGFPIGGEPSSFFFFLDLKIFFSNPIL